MISYTTGLRIKCDLVHNLLEDLNVPHTISRENFDYKIEIENCKNEAKIKEIIRDFDKHF